MPFFTYCQNNSGGHFDINQQVTLFVIVEANDTESADEWAEDLGLYFDGVDAGHDCSCCGDRWDRAGAGTDEPKLYGKSPEHYNGYGLLWAEEGKPFCIVYHKNGDMTSFFKGESANV